MAKAQAKNVTKKPGTAVAARKTTAAAIPDDIANEMAQDAADGGHGFSSKDLAIPFISILHKMSKKTVKNNDLYVEGAEQGMIINTATDRLYDGDEGIYAIPVKYMRRWTQWYCQDAKSGKGLIKDWGADDSCMKNTSQDDKGRNIVKGTKDQQIVESGDYFILLIDLEAESAEQAIISMTSTQWRAAKKWNLLISQLMVDGPNGKFNPKMFASVYHLTTKPNSNDQGDWSDWSPEFHCLTTELNGGVEIYRKAKNFLNAIDEGSVRVAAPQQEEEAEAEEEAPASAKAKGKRGGF